MALETQTKTVVGQFDYSDEDVNKGVQEFLRQMCRCSHNRIVVDKCRNKL